MSKYTIKFRYSNGEMVLVDDIISEVDKLSDKNLSKTGRDIVINKLGKLSKKFNTTTYSIAPITLLAVATATSDFQGAGIFWDAFMKYLFPYLLDIAKVFCAIKIAQAFYQERRGGRDSGTGMEAVVTYGKWLLLFHLLPWGVELVDQLGVKMLSDLKGGS